MVPTRTGNQGKPGKMGRHFPVGEFCQDWKSQGILLKTLEKRLYWKSWGNLSESNSENPTNMVPYFKKRTFKNTGKLQKILEKSGKFVSPKKWEPCIE